MTTPARRNDLRGIAGPSFLLLLLGCIWVPPAEARRELHSDDLKARTQRIERIHIEALALTSRGSADAAGIVAAVGPRLESLGYAVVPDPAQPHDATVKVKCEEVKTWEGPIPSGGDNDVPGAASRLWKGPACQLHYRLDGAWSDWHHEIRGPLPSKDAGAQRAAWTGLMARLNEDPFPLRLAAEWGQSARLLHTMDQADASTDQKVLAITLLGSMSAAEAIPAMGRAVSSRDDAVAEAAAVALGAIGHQDGIPILLDLLRRGQGGRHRAAIVGLGKLAPLHPQIDIVPALLDALPREPIPLQTEIVRAVGNTPDRRILGPLRALDRTVRAKLRSDSTPELKELSRALGIALDQFDGTHTSE